MDDAEFARQVARTFLKLLGGLLVVSWALVLLGDYWAVS